MKKRNSFRKLTKQKSGDMAFKALLNKPAAQAAGADPSDATPPVGKIRRFIKIAVTFEPIMQF